MDITAEFLESCKELELGEVVNFSGFNMADAMSAIEIMDPKMDLGMQPYDENLGLENSIKSGKVNVVNVDLSELVAIMDATFAMVVSWLHGQPLDQTVFTNVCLLDLDRLEDPLLANFCCAIINFIHCIKSCIESASVYCEEDYSPHSCRLVAKLEFWTPLKELQSAIDLIQSRNVGKSQLRLQEAVVNRLCLLQSFFDLFSHLIPSSPGSSPNFRKGIAAAERAIAQVTIAIRTVDLGTQPPESVTEDGDFSWLPHFQPDVNRYVLPPSFPRTPKFVGRSDALKYLLKLLRIIKQMATDLPERINEIERLVDFFQIYGGESSCTLSRAIAQLLVMPHDCNICGTQSLADIIQESLRHLDEFLCGENPDPILSLMNNPALADRVRPFVMYCVRAFVGVFQMFGHNQGQQRDRLMRNCFEDLGVLQVEATDIEDRHVQNIRAALEARNEFEAAKTAYAPSVLTNFVLFHILRLMHYHFELGFRLDLFVPYEFPYVYWYMGEIVSNQLSSILERRCSLTVLNFSRKIAALDAKKPSKKQQLRLRIEADLRKRIGHAQADIFRHKVEVHLCQAYAKFACALRLSGRLPASLYGSESQELLRYILRFGAFSTLPSTPTTLNVPYDLYLSASGFERMMSENSAESIFGMASRHFENAVCFLKSLESQDDYTPDETMLRLTKTAKQNAIVSKLLTVSPNLEKKVVFEGLPKENPMFPLIKLV